MSLAACLIVKNEAGHLEKCLSSLMDVVDEIIVVDTGSTDNTVEIANRFTDKIFRYNWDENFSNARNFSISKASSDWILVIDADEVIKKEDFAKIRSLISENKADAITLKQLNYTNQTDELGFIPLKDHSFKGYIPCNIIRVFRNNKKIMFSNPVHESVDASIKQHNFSVLKSDIPLHHYQDEKGMQKLKEKQIRYMRMCEENIEAMENKAKAHRDIAIIASNFLNDYEKAIYHFNKSLEHNPNSLKTYIGLGWAYIKDNKPFEAEKVFFRALKIHPNNAVLYASIGHACEQQNKLQRALDAYHDALILGYHDKEKLHAIMKRLKAQMDNPYSFEVHFR